MPTKPTKQTLMRLPEDIKQAGEDQAARLGLDFTSYIKMIIKLDPSIAIEKLIKKSFDESI